MPKSHSRKRSACGLPTYLALICLVAVAVFFWSDAVQLLPQDAAQPVFRGAVQSAKFAHAVVTEPAQHGHSEQNAEAVQLAAHQAPVPPPVAIPAARAATAIELAEAAAKAAIDDLIAERAAWREEPEPAEVSQFALDWAKHSGKSCQGSVESSAQERTLEESKAACGKTEGCAAIMCPHAQESRCTLRLADNLLPYAPEDCYLPIDDYKLNPKVNFLINQQLCFRGVHTQRGRRVNIVIVQRPPDEHELKYVEQYKNEILFLAISSFEDWPLDAMNPFSPRLSKNKFRSVFPGFLHMMKDPESYFPTSVKTMLMSQSDFMLPDFPERDYSIPRKYDFTLSGSDQDVAQDCVGWSSYAKNWSFVKESLEVMCGEYNLRGALVATISKDGKKACTIPKSCEGKMIQTKYISQGEYHNYLKQSRFGFMPQVHDASPRVITQSLAMDVPVLMNAHISGGWKYLNKKTGEFFTDMRDFRQSLERILKGADTKLHYEPRKWVRQYYGDKNSGKRLFKFVKKNFADRTTLPKGTKLLITESDR